LFVFDESGVNISSKAQRSQRNTTIEEEILNLRDLATLREIISSSTFFSRKGATIAKKNTKH